MARWIVDGMNVIGSRPDGWWRDRPAAMRRLVAELERLADEGEDVTVVFEAKPRDPPRSDRIGVEFARRGGRDAADDEIARLVASDPDPASLRVVTSDRGLGARVRKHGAEVVGAAQLRRRLDELAAR
ncbi:MAG: YacP-like domain protein [Solirubrobacterales bacterium]|nr:YacP-like domain protein [Solirubrobacterales bacterium]